MDIIDYETPEILPEIECRMSVEELAVEIARRLSGERFLIAIAGPPGSGKSTMSRNLKDFLEKEYGLKTQVVPMDGFHYDNAILDQIGLLKRKGAPETFDVGGLESILKRLSGTYRDKDIAIPVFDREIEMSRASARLIDKETEILLVEGNYLLMNQKPWSCLGQYFDLTAIIACDEATLRTRLMKRWLDLDYSESQAAKKVETNDLPNAKKVVERSNTAEFTLV